MTMGFAHAFGPTVRVNCIMPGAFRTDVTDWWGDEMFAATAASLPSGGWVSPTRSSAPPSGWPPQPPAT